ncbi:sensor histidine kinase [Eupransor demetentiae]|uniref:histidine kinase n=1 Tax=Eupransor demetentiae TaxID=3109584 RepID=A0ABM9N5B8_9LACO|nr:K+-sensing histidine kinase KdpD (KdpD) [Lactobacillaceae bacterium LMG 33000]
MIKRFLRGVGLFLREFWYLYLSYVAFGIVLLWSVTLRSIPISNALDVCWALGYLLLVLTIYLAWRWTKQNLTLQRMQKEEHLDSLPELQTRSSSDKHYQYLLARLLEQQNQLREQLRQENQDLQDYYALWAHQIKVPLSVMDLMNQTSTIDPAQSKEQLLLVNQYLDMMLQFIRLRGDDQDLNFREVDVRNLLTDVIKEYRYWFIHKDLTVRLTDEKLKVVSDSKWLHFVFEQIIFNAIKYTPAAGRITIEIGPDGQVVIRDTGIGISQSDLPLIFNQGYTGFNGRLDNNASGIGLYLVKEILTKLGHSINIQSEVQVGTTVTIDLKQRDFGNLTKM